MKIALALPHYGTIKAKTAFSLLQLMKLDFDFYPLFAYGPYISENRETLVDGAKDCDYILFVDHDVVFDPTLLLDLLHEDKDIIGASYNYRHLPPQTLVKCFPNETLQEEPTKVAGIPTGFLLVKMSVFNKLEKPYFPMEYKDGRVICTEDIGFSEKARKAGFDLWCYKTVKHIGDYEY